jgi:hypothetical protein
MKALITFVLCSFLASYTIAQTASTSSTPMTTSQFNQFYQNAHSHGLESLSAENAEDTFTAMFPSTSSYFSTAQVKRLLSSIAKDSGKLAMARYLYGRVTDPHNFLQLAGLFRSETYRHEFTLWVNDPDKQPYADNTISQLVR